MNEREQSTFTGYAIVEMLGHRKEIGFVTTESYGAAVLFRVNVPALPEREYVLTRPAYAGIDNSTRYCPAGTKVKRPESPARSCLVAPGSLYALNPCTEEAALRAIEESMSRPLILLELPADMKALPVPDSEFDDVYEAAEDEEG